MHTCKTFLERKFSKKIKVSLGKGKSKFDKRQSIKQKEWDKEKAKTTNIDRNFK